MRDALGVEIEAGDVLRIAGLSMSNKPMQDCTVVDIRDAILGANPNQPPMRKVIVTFTEEIMLPAQISTLEYAVVIKKKAVAQAEERKSPLAI